MVDSDQNEPEKDKNDKNDKNESSAWNLADYLIETPAHPHDASATETEVGSLPEPSAETEIHPQESVHTESSSLFEPSGEKQVHSTYPVYTEPGSEPETSAETELHLQDACHAESSSLSEPSGEKQIHSTYPIYTEPSSEPETGSLVEPSVSTGRQPEEVVHAETSSPNYVSPDAETHPQGADHAEANPLVEPNAGTEFRWQEAVHAEASTPSYVSPDAETHPENSAVTEAETERHNEPAEPLAADEPRTEPAEPDRREPDREKTDREGIKPPIAHPEVIPPSDLPEPAKRRTNVAFLFAAAAIAVLIVLAGVFIAIYWQQLNSVPTADSTQAAQPPSPTDAKDLGTVDSSAAGLKGHLTTKWDGSLEYSFVIEPDDPARQAAFAMTVSNPPRAASVTIQIKDADGVVMCKQDVLLKFDPRKAAEINKAAAEKPTRKPLGAKAAEAIQEEQETELDRQVTAEAEREHGKSMFQVNAGASGRIESISSQGEIPCPQSVYESMGYWSFLPDFPTPAEQTAWANHQPQVPVKVEATEASASDASKNGANKNEGNKSEASKTEAKKPPPQPAAHQRMTYKTAAAPGTFSIAGDDAIVEYDASAGSIGTRTGKVFSIDKAGAEARAIQGYDLPVTIHYTCDQFAACTLTHGGVVIARARLSQ